MLNKEKLIEVLSGLNLELYWEIMNQVEENYKNRDAQTNTEIIYRRTRCTSEQAIYLNKEIEKLSEVEKDVIMNHIDEIYLSGCEKVELIHDLDEDFNPIYNCINVFGHCYTYGFDENGKKCKLYTTTRWWCINVNSPGIIEYEELKLS